MTQIGDILYCFDINRRKYDEQRRIIINHHYRSETIIGETKLSWLVGDPFYRGSISKVNKRTLAEAGKNGFGGYQWFTKEGMEDDLWQREHRSDIANKVRGAPVPILRRIAALLSLT